MLVIAAWTHAFADHYTCGQHLMGWYSPYRSDGKVRNFHCSLCSSHTTNFPERASLRKTALIGGRNHQSSSLPSPAGNFYRQLKSPPRLSLAVYTVCSFKVSVRDLLFFILILFLFSLIFCIVFPFSFPTTERVMPDSR